MVYKTITVRFGKCTTLLVPKSWPMKAWLRDFDQWKAENFAGFCNWPITRCFVQNDRARLIIEHTTNFALSGNIDGPCNFTYETEFVLFLAVLENSSMGWDSSHAPLKVMSELLISEVTSLLVHHVNLVSGIIRLPSVYLVYGIILWPSGWDFSICIGDRW